MEGQGGSTGELADIIGEVTDAELAKHRPGDDLMDGLKALPEGTLASTESHYERMLRAGDSEAYLADLDQAMEGLAEADR